MLIAIEGIDGSGKGTQAGLLAERLRAIGARVQLLQFPRYSETFFGKEIGLYLNGEFGSLMDVHPKLGALLYAGDRFESREYLRTLLGENDVVICDRYTPSNQAHHAAKLSPSEWPAFFRWTDQLEHEIFGLPRPDLVIFLDVDARSSAVMIRQKPQRSYTSRAADIHEVNELYQENVYNAYRQLVEESRWTRVVCMVEGCVLDETDISQQIWTNVEPEFVEQLAAEVN